MEPVQAMVFEQHSILQRKLAEDARKRQAEEEEERRKKALEEKAQEKARATGRTDTQPAQKRKQKAPDVESTVTGISSRRVLSIPKVNLLEESTLSSQHVLRQTCQEQKEQKVQKTNEAEEAERKAKAAKMDAKA